MARALGRADDQRSSTGGPSHLRVLGRLRLSVASDESTSIDRQREIISSWAETHGHDVVGWAEDVDVSGSVDPFDTPQLGDWLNNRAAEFDIVVTWKLDRLSRNSIKLNNLFGWCLDHGKTVVSCSEAIDLGTPVGRLIANVIAFLAEGELEAIRERTKASRQKLRELSRWPGGRPPYGYRSVDNPRGAGKVLEFDPYAYDVVRRIVDAVIDGTPLVRVVRGLNREGVRPPADHYRVSVGRQDTLSSWRTGPVKLMLQSPTLVGYAHVSGTAVRDDLGQPVQLAEPLVSDDERTLVLAELHRAQGVPRERGEPAPLAGIVVCWFCGTRLTMTRQKKKYRYYRCPKACSSLIPADDAETLAEEAFLAEYGNREVVDRVWVSGDTNETELRKLVAAFDEISSTAGAMTSRTAKDRFQRQLAALDARIAELESQPAREGGYEDRPTGELYRDVWDRETDPAVRRDLLKRAEVFIRIGISGVDRRTPNNGGSWHAEISSSSRV